MPPRGRRYYKKRRKIGGILKREKHPENILKREDLLKEFRSYLQYKFPPPTKTFWKSLINSRFSGGSLRTEREGEKRPPGDILMRKYPFRDLPKQGDLLLTKNGRTIG